MYLTLFRYSSHRSQLCYDLDKLSSGELRRLVRLFFILVNFLVNFVDAEPHQINQ